ncbi:MAG: beta-ketoacyl-ACP synthase II [Anaerolineae bacterium]|nr:beta-ketoacyl-ACP synthase II [Anaerolineae bacterium]MDQ7037293.1 beta-ketoacyl-ACP synthase II [Anaerolineae bacterium]
MKETRIVVTGMGLVSPVGNTVQESWDNIRNGRSGIDWIKVIDTEQIRVKVAGEVKNFNPTELFHRRIAKRADRAQMFALFAAQEALADSGIEVTEDNMYGIGVSIGTGIGAIGTTVEAVRSFSARGTRGVRVHMVPSLLADQISAQVSMELNLRGPNYTIVNACSTGNNAIGDAADMLRLGRANVMVAGGSEACIIDVVLTGLDNMKTVGMADGDPKLVSRPFDVTRQGFVAGEGCGVLILERLEDAEARGAKIYAELTGYGHTADAFHVTAPRADGESAAYAMTQALADAGIEAKDLSYINAHGTGTPLNDKTETKAIKLALGEEAYNVPISSTKSMTGHMLGAAGAAEAVFSIMALQDNYLPPTINLHNPDPECDLDYVPNVGRDAEVNHIMSNAFGFGGHNAVLIMSRYTG